MATNSHNRQRPPAEKKYIETVTKALSDGDLGRLTIIVGAGVTLGAIKCGRTALSDIERNERIRGLGWQGLLLGGPQLPGRRRLCPSSIAI
jgi:hypothetical protein